jgi:hypothetical protein
VWPDMEEVADPESAEWLGAQPGNNEEEHATVLPLPGDSSRRLTALGTKGGSCYAWIRTISRSLGTLGPADKSRPRFFHTQSGGSAVVP